MICPAAVNAAPEAEPLPPDGFSQDQLFDAFLKAFGEDLGVATWKWFRTTWPAWARSEARAHQKAYEWCQEKLQQAGSNSPPAR